MNDLSIKKLSTTADEVRRAKPQIVTVRGKSWKLRRLGGKTREKIDCLNKEAYVLSAKVEQEMTVRKAKRISRKLYSLHAKTAACYVLGRWAVFRPLYAIYWRWLHITKDSEQICNINEHGMKDPHLDFSLANWQITNAQLALSMRLIGKEMDEYQKRMGSAEKQAREDGTPTSQGDKSGVSSDGQATTSESSTSTATIVSGHGSDTGT